MSSWTDDRVETLKTMVGEGYTASQIAARLRDVSRNAVIGKAHRVGVTFAASPCRAAPSTPRAAAPRAIARPARPAQPPKPKPPAPAPRLGIAGNTAIFVREAGAPPKGEAHLAPIEVAAAPRPWVTRRFGECAFPVDGEGADVRSCCNPTLAVYCDGHQAFMRGQLPASWREFDRPRFIAKVA